MSLKHLIQKWQSGLAQAGHIQCWTIMERSTWQLLTAHGELTCPISNTCQDELFPPAYEWMKRAMAEAGLHAPTAELSPWWCWVRRESDHHPPYLEDVECLDDPVILELLIPANELILSCFDRWHYVLNRFYVAVSDEDEADFERALAAVEPDSMAAALLEERLQRSWRAVFELDQCAEYSEDSFAPSIQGCFWRLCNTFVTAVLAPEDLDSYAEEENIALTPAAP